MASLTTAGNNVALVVPKRGESISISISGTYAQTIELQRELGSRGSGSWQTLRSWSTANATVAEIYKTEREGEHLRLFARAVTSGTAVATLADNDNCHLGQVNGASDGNPVVEYKQGGVKFRGAIERASGVVPITVATTLTAEQHAGKTMVFNIAAGVAVTLPPAIGSGNRYNFFVATTVTSLADVIQVTGTDTMAGNLIANSTGDNPDLAQPWPTGATSDTITLNGGTKGGILGDWIELEDVAVALWSVRGIINQSGTEETPFSAAVPAG